MTILTMSGLIWILRRIGIEQSFPPEAWIPPKNDVGKLEIKEVETLPKILLK